MNLLLKQVEMFFDQVNKGEIDFPPELAEEFGNKCRDIITKQMSRRETTTGPTIRLSAIGRPLCQQQMERALDVPMEAETADPYLRFKMLFGELIEAAAIVCMKAAGVPIENEQQEVKLELAGEMITGHIDVEIDGGIYDLKSASPYSFDNKFDTFENVIKDDPFGYAIQGFTYGAATGKPFKGWIVVNKVTGQWRVCETPPVPDFYRKKAVQQAEENVHKLMTDAPFERCFDLEDETWYGKKTGNKVLSRTCTYCAFKKPCWGDKVQQRPNPKSKTGALKYYFGEPK